MTPQGPTSNPIEQFLTYAKGLPLEQLDDDAFNSIRDQWFYENQAAEIAQKGLNIEEARRQFAEAAVRPGKTRMPLAKVAATTAVRAFAAPFNKLSSDSEWLLENAANKAIDEAKYQGLNPQWAEMGGEVLGQAPYWIAGMGVAHGLNAGRIGAKALEITAGTLIQGAYDAAKSDTPAIDGLKGAAIGGLGTAAYEAVGPLWRALTRKGLSEEAAKTVERVAKGIGDETDKAAAADALMQVPDLEETVMQHMAQTVKTAQEAGMPRDVFVQSLVPKTQVPREEMRNMVRISLKGADGKDYNVTAPVAKDPAQFDKLWNRILEHTQQGGQVTSIEGGPAGIQGFFRALTERTDLPMFARDIKPGEKVKLSLDQVINARNSVYHATDWQGFHGVLTSGEIRPFRFEPIPAEALDDSAESAAILAFQENKALALTLNPEVAAEAGVSVSRVPRFASKADKPITFVLDPAKMPRSRPYTEVGYAKTTTNHPLYEGLDDDQIQKIQEMAFAKGLQKNPSSANEKFEFENRTFNEPVSIDAVKGILIDEEALAMAQKDALYETEESLYSVKMIEDWARGRGIPTKVFKNGAEMHKYRASLAKQEESMRWAVDLKKVPPSELRFARDLDVDRVLGKVKRPEDYEGYGSWVSPEAESNLVEGMDHFGWAKSQGKTPKELFKEGWVRVSSSGVQTSPKGLKSLGFLKAVREAADVAEHEELSAISLDVLAPGSKVGRWFNEESLEVPLDQIEDLLENPEKWIRRQRLAGKNPRFAKDISRRDMLKSSAGAAAGGMLSPEQLAQKVAQLEGALKGAEAGSAAAKSFLSSMVEDLGYKITNLGKKVIELTSLDGPDALPGYSRLVRTAESLSDTLEMLRADDAEVADVGLIKTLSHWSEFPDKVKGQLTKELQGKSFNDLKQLAEIVWDDIDDEPLTALRSAIPHWDELHAVSKRHTSAMQDWLEARGKSMYREPASATLKKMKKEDFDEILAKHNELLRIRDEEYARSLASRGYKEPSYEETMRPTGMELQRTPLGLGEGGDEGLLMRFARGDAFWIHPDGQKKPLPAGLHHAEAPPKGFRRYEDALAKGYVRLRGNTISLRSDTPDEALITATMEASRAATDAGEPLIYVELDDLGKESFVMLQDLHEFINNPKRYVERNAYELGTVRRAVEGESSTKYKETPLSHRFTGDVGQMLGDEPGAMAPKGVTLSRGQGAKPSILYQKGKIGRDTIFHENLHGHVSYLGMDGEMRAVLNSKEVDDIFHGAFDPESKEIYLRNPEAIPEEVFAYLSSAVRIGDNELIQRFADANGGKEHLLNWTTEKSLSLLEFVNSAPDSIHKRTFERKLQSVITRATKSISDVETPFRASGEVKEVGYAGRRGWYARESDGVKWFGSRDEALGYLEANHGEPLLTPELVDLSLVPEGTLRRAVALKPPNGEAPQLGDVPEVVVGGAQIASSWIRPFFSWLSDVAVKHNRPDLYEAFKTIDDRWIDINNFVRPYTTGILKDLHHYPEKRQRDFFKYFQADAGDKAAMVEELRLTPKELGMLTRFDEEFMQPLAAELGIDLRKYINDYAPRIREHYLKTGEPLVVKHTTDAKVQTEFWADEVRKGELDPTQENLLRVARTYLHAGSRSRFLGEPLARAEALVNEMVTVGDSKAYRLGTLQPGLKRHLEYMRGIPDASQNSVDSFVRSMTEVLNETYDKINSKLPDRLHIPKIESPPRDLLGKFMLFSYAGALALRPIVVIRDLAQLYISGYPVLGNDLWAGMRKVLPTLKGKKGDWDPNIIDIPKRVGSLLEKRDLTSLAQNTTTGGKLQEIAEASLGFAQWGNNVNRLISHWGFKEKVDNAWAKFSPQNDWNGFLRESGAWFLNKSDRSRWVEKLRVAQPDQWEEYSHQIARDLVEATQWNLRRGASPALYKYQLGRLFGQYGTWPLHYIEYGRRFMNAEDRGAAHHALGRLVASHGAIQASGAALGVDLSNWVWWHPGAFSGGPLLDTLRSIPGSLDAGPRGEEARNTIGRNIFGQVPGINQLRAVHKAFTEDEEDMWKNLLGFTPMDDKDLESGKWLVP